MTTQELLEALGEADDAFIMEAGRKQHNRTGIKAENAEKAIEGNKPEQTAETEPAVEQGQMQEEPPKPAKAGKAAAAGAFGGLRAFWRKKQTAEPEIPAAPAEEQPAAVQTEPDTIPEQPAAAAPEPETEPAQSTAGQPEASELTVTLEKSEHAEAAECAESAESAEGAAAVEFAAAAEAAEVLNIPAAAAMAAPAAETTEEPAAQASAEESAEAGEQPAAENVIPFPEITAEKPEAAENTENTEKSEAGEAAGTEAEADAEDEEEDEEAEDGGTGKSTVKRLMPVLIAACLLLVVVGVGASSLLYRFTKSGGSASADVAVAAAAAEQAAPEEEVEPPAMTMQAADESTAEAAAEESTDSASEAAWQLTPLAQAAEIQEPDSWDESNEVSYETANAINMFSYQTAAEILSGSDSSVCYSPLSLYQTLAVLASGAEGDTQSQILDLMGLSSADTLADEIQKSVRWNTKNEDNSVLQISNSIWLDDTAADGTPIDYNQDWVVTASDDYYADVYAADFSDQAAIDSTLGGWVAEKTGGLLSPTAEEMGLTSDTVMAIVNTLNYRTEWAEAFSEDDTEEDTFTTADGEEVAADFMHITIDEGSVIHGSDFTKSRLRLSTGKMIIVLPDEGVDIDDLLTEDKLIEIFENSGYQDAKVNWSVPKFETTNAATDLADMLQDLGVTDAFSEENADFSEISDTSLYLGSICQGTCITVNENGIQAAAWTAAGMETAAELIDEPEEVDMNLNRPFLYLITSDDGSTLFMGVVRNPLD